MKSNHYNTVKHALHNELILKHREFFESKLAINIVKNNKAYASTHKISSAITQLIQANKSTVIDLMTNDEKIISELREPYFGSCYNSTETVDPADALDKILSILTDKSADIRSTLQIHCIFIHRIYDTLEKKDIKTQLVSTLFPNSLFSKENRCRSEVKTSDTKRTSQFGITKHPVFAKMLEQSDKEHIRALDKFTPNKDGLFASNADKENLPLVCGPSGHTGSLMLGAKLYGNLNKQELKEYAILCFAFLAAGGNHSFHEVMTVAALAGVDYQAGNYAENVPTSMMEDTKHYLGR